MRIPKEILLKYIIHIAKTEKRVISYKDCLRFNFEGQEYTMEYGTFRNKISNLIKNKRVVKVYHSNIAFYKPVGYDVNGNKVTDNGAGISTNTPLYKLIKNTVLDKNAIHNIRLKFECKNIWNIFSFIMENNYNILVSNKISTFSNTNDTISLATTTSALDIPDTINSQSKDICFKSMLIKGFKVDITIHKTDTVTIIIGCSYNPIVLDIKGYIDFSALLSVIEERFSRLVNDCSIYYWRIQKELECKNNNKIDSSNTKEADHGTNINNNVFIKIPSYKNWIITMWHFGADSISSYHGERFHISLSNFDKTVHNIYSKQYGKRQKIRIERQEYPNKKLIEAIDEKLRNNI